VTSPRGAGSIPRLRGAPRQARWDRRRVRTTDTGRTRAPSIGSTRTSRPGRATSRSLFTCTASPRTLSPATNRTRLVKGWKVASGYPAARAPRRLPLGSPRQRERCVSPTSATNTTIRAPCGLPDSRARAGATPSRARFRALPIHLRSKTSDRSPGGASLDGEPPASAWSRRPASSRCVTEALAPDAGEDGNDALRGPGEASIEGSSARRHPAAEFSSAYRAHDIASDVLCRDPARTGSSLSAGPARAMPPGSPPRPPRQRRSLRRNQDAFPRRVLTPPRPRSLRTEGTGSSRARHRAHGFAAASRLPTPFHRPSTRPDG